MLTLSDSAVKELAAYFDGKEKSPLRVYLAPGGCSGPRLALALDNPHETDTVLTVHDHTFCINSELLATAQSIHIDLSYMGFSVESAVPLGGGGGGCGGCGGGCSSHSGEESSGCCSGGCGE